MRFAIAIVLEIVLFLSAHVLGWGNDGHRIVGLIAEKLVSPQTLKIAKEFIGHDDFASAATWADSIKHSVKYRWSEALHYINTPDWQCKFIAEKDCADHFCVSAAIANYSQRLSNSALSPAQRTEAFKFVVHFVGDIHQPLHAGFASDLGGNTIKGNFLGKNDLNLHWIWDQSIIQNRMDSDFNGSEEAFLEYLLGRVNGDLAGQVKQWSNYSENDEIEWADSSAKDACVYAYSDQNAVHIRDGFNLGMEYYKFALPQIEKYLIQAGVRLSALLGAALDANEGNDLKSNIIY